MVSSASGIARVRVGAFLDQLVGAGGSPVGHLELTRGEQEEDGFQVPAAGPADLTSR